MQLNKQLDIVAFGEAMVEFNQTGENNGLNYLQGFGGDTSNFAIASARSGAKVAVIGALGEDPYSVMIRSLWDKEGINHDEVLTDKNSYTAIYFVTHGPSGHEFSFFRKGSAASRITPSALPTRSITTTRVLHLSGISVAISPSACDSANSALELAKSNGALISFDTNLRLKLWSLSRARTIILDFVSRSDICLPSFDDISVLTGLTDPNQLVDCCLKLGAKIVALKLGDKGALVADSNQRHRIEAFPCHSRDATGAGDTFGGAFVTRLLAGDDLQSAGLYACAAAALSTQGFGAVNPIPYAQEINKALSKRVRAFSA
jgi:2-dehydro-3-deoxygluconokinase